MSFARGRRKPASTASPSPPSTTLLHLVPELVEEVASFLDPVDLCALRMTCKALYNKTSTVFWRTSLRDIQTDLSLASLQKLETLSNNPQLCKYIHHLTFRGFDDNGYILGEGFEWNRHESGHLISLQDQPAVKCLLPILQQLVNCRSFECWSADTPEYPDLADTTRATDAVQVILDIVAEDRLPVPVSSFTVNFRAYHTTAHGYLDPRRLDLGYFKKAGFGAQWAQLEELVLDLTLEFEITRTWASDLILAAPNIKKLDLNLDTDDYTPVLIQRLASTDSLRWPRLQEVRLNGIRTSVAHFTALLRRCQSTLRVLSIGVLRTDASMPELKEFFQTLSTFPSLQEADFEAWWAGTGLGAYGFQIVHYQGIPDNSTLDETEKARITIVQRMYKGTRWNRFVRYSGPQMPAVLEMLARSVGILD